MKNELFLLCFEEIHPVVTAKMLSFLKNRIKSVVCASKGVMIMLSTEHNAWVHAAATLAVVIVGLALGFSRWEWCLIVLAMVTVWTAEALNTAFEFLSDLASPEFHPLAEKAKDVAAGAVLITAVGAVIIGVLVITPYLVRIFE